MKLAAGGMLTFNFYHDDTTSGVPPWLFRAVAFVFVVGTVTISVVVFSLSISEIFIFLLTGCLKSVSISLCLDFPMDDE